MAKILLSAVRGRNNTSTTNAGSTQYWWLANSSLSPSTTVAQRDVTWRTPGTISKLYVRITANSTSQSGVVVVRKNGVDSALTLSVPAGTTGVFENTTDTVTVADGDELVYKTISFGTGTFTLSLISVIFDATTNIVARHSVEGYSVVENAATRYLPVSGDRSGTTGTESAVESTIKKACTAKNAFIYVHTNARVNDTTFTLRKNRVDTAIVLTVGAGVTGIVEDTSNSVAFSVDDEISWEITPGAGTESLSFHGLTIDIETTSNYGFITAGSVGTAADNPVVAATTVYAAVGGAHFFDATEDNVKMKAREAFTISNLTLRLGVNTVTAASTLTLRVNGSDTALVATATASTIGFFSDTTHLVNVEPGDELSLKYTTGATGTTTTVSNFSMWLYPAVRITQTAILKYNIVGRVVNSAILKYNLVGRILNSAILKYNIFQSVAQSIILKYNILERIANNVILKYNLVGRVLSSLILKYNIFGRVTQSIILAYNILGRVIQNLILRYHIVERITNTVDLKYHIFERISNSVIAEYNIVGRITNNVVVSYNLVGRIARGLIVRYNLRERIANSVIFKYNLLERITNNVIPKYNIAGRINNALSVKYRIAGRIIKNLIARYHLRGRVTSTLDIKYNIIERIFQSLIVAYDIAEPVYARVINQLDLAYNIFVRTQNQMTLRYGIVGRVIEVLTIKFNQRGRMPRNPDLKSAFSRFPAKTIRDMFRL